MDDGVRHPLWSPSTWLCLLANFYPRFIRDYSFIATPLHQLTSTLQTLVWTPDTECAFTRLKKLFTPAPILTLPDPTRQLIMEVDDSDLGVGAVLYQKEPRDNKLHPFLSLFI